MKKLEFKDITEMVKNRDFSQIHFELDGEEKVTDAFDIVTDFFAGKFTADEFDVGAFCYLETEFQENENSLENVLKSMKYTKYEIKRFIDNGCYFTSEKDFIENLILQGETKESAILEFAGLRVDGWIEETPKKGVFIRFF